MLNMIVERERCKREGESCSAGSGVLSHTIRQGHGACCNDGFAPVECQYNGPPGSVGKCTVGKKA